MQEEVNSRTIALCVTTGKMTAAVLQKVLRAYLDAERQRKNIRRQNKAAVKAHGKTTGRVTVKELAKQNAGMTNIEITNDNIRSFERFARKYSINYALKKDKTRTPPVYLVFFKGRDQDALTQAFREFTQYELKRANRPSIRSRLAKLLQKQKTAEPERQEEMPRRHQKSRERERARQRAREGELW